MIILFRTHGNLLKQIKTENLVFNMMMHQSTNTCQIAGTASMKVLPLALF